jgi:two-component system, chemotaxis family, response regulator Rcp1
VRGRKVEILSIEDSDADRGLLEAEFACCETPHRLNFVCDGEEAIRYLFKQGKYANSTTPDLVLLDLNLPLKNGTEVLREIKADVNLKRIPVIVLSTSSHPKDVSSAYELGASGFITKPSELAWFRAAIRSIEAFWMKAVDLPNNPAHRPY